MYLEHFGLTEPPFKITPVTEFFFSGANRGEILDALIYAITDSEGIVKISGEVGSGKTMLCRMLLERLPANVKAIYLANPSLSRDELLYAIADGLGLNLEGQRVSVFLQNLHNHLVAQYNQGIRCVVLVDEAHAMPLDTLEELRLLYNLQVGKHKLIQIVLFGQPELDDKLEQTNMRQLKDRILHNFNMQPLSKQVIESYLMFRMRAAGYHGPNVFSPAAINLIGKASQGLMRRVNILADKSLLAAFVENTHNVDTKHVQAAIRDTELAPKKFSLKPHKNLLIAGGASLATLLLAFIGWHLGQDETAKGPAATAAPISISPASAPMVQPIANASAPQPLPVAASAVPAPALAPVAATTSAVAKLPHNASMLQQRLAATEDMLAQYGKNGYSIQLYFTEDTNAARMERFLGRAKNIGKLSEIYILPIKLGGKKGFRVLYGAYSNSTLATEGMKQLPQKYKDAFAPALHPLEGVTLKNA